MTIKRKQIQNLDKPIYGIEADTIYTIFPTINKNKQELSKAGRYDINGNS